MEEDIKVTYITIGILIIILGGVAYFLQGEDTTTEIKTNATTTPVKKLVNTTSVKTATTTNASSTVTNSSTTETMQTPEKITSATITTNKGTIEVSFATDKPLTVKNFTKLASEHFYDGIRFHRVIKDFMIQAGDPLSKDVVNQPVWGTGGPGYKFQDELTGKETYPLGTLAMANSGPNTNGSQFFIVTANPGAPLPPSYTVFGKVTKGIETALAIQNIKTTGSPSDRPLEEVVIQKIELR